MKFIKLNESQYKRLFESDITALGSENPSSLPSYTAGETFTTNPIKNEYDGEDMGNPPTTDKFANTMADNRLNRRR